ncbi:MAG: hypothetical protein IT536_01690 [Hyphomicrobiales bacterium]|nr:hypothetical protein [Hyphomicrobiales bacterium]
MQSANQTTTATPPSKPTRSAPNSTPYGLTTAQVAAARTLASERGYKLKALLDYQSLVVEARHSGKSSPALLGHIEEARDSVLGAPSVEFRVPTPIRFKPATPEAFIAARDKSALPGFLSPLAPEDLRDHKLLMNDNHTVGFALDPYGNIQNVFNNGGPWKAGCRAVTEAIAMGGRTLDCYDGFLPKLYSQFGSKEVGRHEVQRRLCPTQLGL